MADKRVDRAWQAVVEAIAELPAGRERDQNISEVQQWSLEIADAMPDEEPHELNCLCDKCVCSCHGVAYRDCPRRNR